MKILSTIALALATAALVAGTANAGAAKNSGFFKTQNGKIYCIWGTGLRGFVVCGIKNGHLKPAADQEVQGHRPHGRLAHLQHTGQGHVQPCSGDAGPFADPAHTKVQKAGTTWRAGGMSCTFTTSSATCKNKSQHGFTITTPGTYKTVLVAHVLEVQAPRRRRGACLAPRPPLQ